MELIVFGIFLVIALPTLNILISRWLERQTTRTEIEIHKIESRARDLEIKEESKFAPREYLEPQPITGNHYDTDYSSTTKRCRHNIDKQACAFCSRRREVITNYSGKTVYKYYPSGCYKDLLYDDD